MIKILVVGDQNWGKTSIINRFIYGKYTNKILATVACEHSYKSVIYQDVQIKLNIWDIAGQDRLGGVSKLFCRDAAGAIVVSDIVQEDTLENAVEWKNQVEKLLNDGSTDSCIPMVLAVNKYDLIKNYETDQNKELDTFMTKEYVEEFAYKNGFKGWLRTSAKEDHNIAKTFDILLSRIIEANTEMDPETEKPDMSTFKTESILGSIDHAKRQKQSIINLQSGQLEYRGKKKKKWW